MTGHGEGLGMSNEQKDEPCHGRVGSAYMKTQTRRFSHFTGRKNVVAAQMEVEMGDGQQPWLWSVWQG